MDTFEVGEVAIIREVGDFPEFGGTECTVLQL